MSTVTAEQTRHIINGIDTDHVAGVAARISKDQAAGDLTFRADNKWLHGSRSRTSIQGFRAGGEEDTSRKQALTVDADQPALLAGSNTAPNSVEHLLHSLTSCLSTTLVYHASVQGIPLEEVRVVAEGDMNARGFFGITNDGPRGYQRIRVNMQVKGDADVETLTRFAMYSPVYDVISRAVPVEFKLTKL